MSKPVEIEVVIDPKTREMTFEIKGMPGTGCTDLTNALTQGKQVLEQENTCEYYENAERPDYIDQGSGSDE